MYVHRMLTRGDHQTNRMMKHLEKQQIGWSKNISEKLEHYGLETNWEVIKTNPRDNG